MARVMTKPILPTWILPMAKLTSPQLLAMELMACRAVARGRAAARIARM